MSEPSKSIWFPRFAWGFVAYLVAVILFGAWVRITHSGAGCGSHWPTCHGELVPLAPSIETVIEYTHRLTSGFLGILGLGLVAGAARAHGWGRVLLASIVTLVFILLEALIGAGLVLKELVADDDSAARAIVISLHLVNTLMLTAAASLTAWWSIDDRPLRFRRVGPMRWVLLLALVALVLTSMTGAVTALGDTLFPVQASDADLLDRVRDDLSAAQHFLVRLRIVHPAVAVLVAMGTFWLASWVGERGPERVSARLSKSLRHALIAQVVIGGANIALAAPGWMQLVHLLVAQAVWVSAVLMVAACAADPPS